MLIGATIGEMPCKVILNLRFSEGRLIHMLLKAHRHHKAGPWGRWLLQAFHHSWKRPEKPHHIRSASQHFWAPFILFPTFLPVFKYHFYHLYLHYLYMKIHLTNTPLIWLYIICISYEKVLSMKTMFLLSLCIPCVSDSYRSDWHIHDMQWCLLNA